MNFIIDPSLILYLPLHELEGDSFRSKDAYGHICTATGASWRKSGCHFDGVDDYIDLPVTSSKTSHTLEFWVYSYNSTSACKYLFDAQTGRLLIGWGADTAGKFGVYGTSGWAWFDSPSANNWHHVVVTLDAGNSKCKAYIDGVQTGGDASYNTPIAIGGTVHLGSRYALSGTWHAFHGLVGEFRIYGRVLTPQEVQHNHLATKWRYQ